MRSALGNVYLGSLIPSLDRRDTDNDIVQAPQIL
jgi:hypothetical protein